MKRLVLMLLSVALVTSCYSQQPQVEIAGSAKNFLELYNTGDIAAAKYVNFNGIYLVDIAMTEEIAKSKFSEMLAEAKGNETPSVEVTEIRLVDDGREVGLRESDRIAYVYCKVNGTTEVLLFYQVDGKWKIDITFKWLNDWFDGRID